MAENRTVTAGDIVSATVKYSNKDSEGRDFDLSADVNISGKRVQSISGGSARTSDGLQVADFNRYDDEGLNINFYNCPDEQKPAVLAAVLGFMANVVASVGEKA